jgi:glycerol-3-phosphate dehydrogenase
MQIVKTQVLIIGGGVTGAGLARDLALRGVNCVIAEKHDINAGASGANHGLLHSGARYVSSDAHSAEECRDESRILKKMAPDCIEDTGGLFVAVAGDDESYIAEFPRLCAKSRIPLKELDIKDALEMEPALSSNTIAAFQVQDASIGPFKLSMENIHQAKALGCDLLRHAQVVGFQIEKKRITATKLRNLLTHEHFMVEAEQVVNAGGAWAKEIAALAGCQIDLLYSKGSLLVTHSRLTKRVINRLRPSSNADILVPGGTVSILGTTSIRIETLDAIFPTVKEIDAIVGEGAAMIPELEMTRYIRAYAGVRPLVGTTVAEGGRRISRSFTLIDHESDSLKNFATITGGKLTTYRLMAEKTADLVCARLGVTNPCVTRTEPLPTDPATRWTKPGAAPKLWIKHNDPQDLLLCECEMVPKSVVNSLAQSIHEQNGKPDLVALGLRSRIGKGTCQGTFCAQRIAAYLYDIEELAGSEGLENIRAFVSERWRGERPLLWDTSLIQAELKEALYCGLFGVELND